MGQRGTTKSHGGCTRCKIRKVKCDESIPCRNCLRRGEACSLAALLSSASRTPEPISQDETHPCPGMSTWIEDMELMYHYTRHVAEAYIGDRQENQAMLRDYLPQQAMKHEFLLHTLLTLSALHLAYLHPAEALHFVKIADRHQTAAAHGYRLALGAAGPMAENANAFFACAVMTSITAMARMGDGLICLCPTISHPQRPDLYSNMLSRDNLGQLFKLHRGVRDVVHTANGERLEGGIMHIFSPTNVPSLSEEPLLSPDQLPPSFQHELNRLHTLFQTQHPPTQPPNPCNENLTIALTDLEVCLRGVHYIAQRGLPFEMGQIWKWPVVVPLGYVDMLVEREPCALVLLAYFAALTAAAHGVWYTEGWGRDCVEGIRRLFAEGGERYHGWSKWLEWPQARIDDGMTDMDGSIRA